MYPVEDKENLYPPRKMPSVGYFIMKGYRPELAPNDTNSQTQKTQCSGSSSQRVLNHMVKKYLARKHYAIQNMAQKPLPKIEHSASTMPEGQTIRQSKKMRHRTRISTELAWDN